MEEGADDLRRADEIGAGPGGGPDRARARGGAHARAAIAAAASVLLLLAAIACVHSAAPPVAAPAASAAVGFRFVDAAAPAGLTRALLAGRPGKDHLLDSAGAGAAFLDYDRDGILDVYLVNDWRIDGNRIVERGRNALYRGRPGGRFEDVTDAAGVDGGGRWGAAVVAADYDDDGWVDLLVTNFGPNTLYRNFGNGRFENVAPRLGIESPGWNTGAAFFDADGDGDLDLYIAAYIDVTVEDVLAARPTLSWKGLEKVAAGPFGMTGARDHFFRQESGRFVDATVEAGLEDRGLAYGFAVRAADFDGDGDIDLYVANDSDANYLYRNEGNGTFREIGLWAGSALSAAGAAQAGMGVAVGDTAGTGRLDIVVTNFSEDNSTLYRNLGGGLFEDASEETGVGPATWRMMSWGAALADLDADGDLDLAIAAGHIYPQIDRHPEIIGTYRQTNMLLENAGGRFRDVTARAGPGFEIAESSRGLAAGDYDNDGDVDLLITNLDAPPTLLRNDTPGGAWLTIACVSRRGGPGPIGTVVTVKSAGRTLLRDIAAGDSFMSSHDPRLHFGLGDATRAEEVEVRWPDGSRTVRRDVPARQFLVIRQGP